MFLLGTKDSGKIVIYRLIEFNSIQLVVSLKNKFTYFYSHYRQSCFLCDNLLSYYYKTQSSWEYKIIDRLAILTFTNQGHLSYLQDLL